MMIFGRNMSKITIFCRKNSSKWRIFPCKRKSIFFAVFQSLLRFSQLIQLTNDIIYPCGLDLPMANCGKKIIYQDIFTLRFFFVRKWPVAVRKKFKIFFVNFNIFAQLETDHSCL